MAESLTGDLIASRLVNVPGASAGSAGGVVAYHEQVKFDVLGVPVGPVVSAPAAIAMAQGVCQVTGSDVGLGITRAWRARRSGGVAHGDRLRGAGGCPRHPVEARELPVPGDPERVRRVRGMTGVWICCAGPSSLGASKPALPESGVRRSRRTGGDGRTQRRHRLATLERIASAEGPERGRYDR